MPRIGYLSIGSPPVAGTPLHPTHEGFLEGLRELGYVDGKTVIIDIRYADGKFERFADLAADLARLKVDLIVTGGGPASLNAARQATSSIPIVMAAASTDPVREGIVTSLARPGGERYRDRRGPGSGAPREAARTPQGGSAWSQPGGHALGRQRRTLCRLRRIEGR